MKSTTTTQQTMPTFDTPPAALAQWQWEEAVNFVRRRVGDEEVARYWRTTGETDLDATARAHIGEWLALDAQTDATRKPPRDIFDALIDRALTGQVWQLHVVEAAGDGAIATRRLRDHRGFRLTWLEGRSAPPPGSTVALRVAHVDPPGVDVATLPICFGGDPEVSRLIAALLRSFGAHRCSNWEAFMGDPGARIVLEYGLSHLREEAQRRQRQRRDERPAEKAA